MPARAARRKRVHSAAATRARALGLTFLQSENIGTVSQTALMREWEAFKRWCRSENIDSSEPRAFLPELPRYLDVLFFAGAGHDRGDKLICVLRYLFPGSLMRDSQAMGATNAEASGG